MKFVGLDKTLTKEQVKSLYTNELIDEVNNFDRNDVIKRAKNFDFAKEMKRFKAMMKMQK